MLSQVRPDENKTATSVLSMKKDYKELYYFFASEAEQGKFKFVYIIALIIFIPVGLRLAAYVRSGRKA